ncbi:MAG: hypothetical protein ACOYM3_21045 [Terrimicrobiaceae bacterium]
MSRFPRSLLLIAFACLAFDSCKQRPPSAAGGSSETADRLASQLDGNFRAIREHAEKLTVFTAGLYEKKAETLLAVERSKYQFAPNGAFHKPLNDGGAAVWISGAVPITQEVQEGAFLTEPLDAELIRTCREFPEISQAYLNDRNSMNRIFPWIDTVSQYPPKMNIPEYNFYYLADEKHNPERRGVWVNEPYLDPAGGGWMVSAIAPVYEGGELVSVAGLDVTISAIIEKYFRKMDHPVIVVARNGVVVAATEKAIELLEMPPLKDHKYLETVKQDTFKPEEYNITKSHVKAVRAMAVDLMEKNANSIPVELSGKSFLAAASPVPELAWKVVEFTPP